jgi:hypothetical protein
MMFHIRARIPKADLRTTIWMETQYPYRQGWKRFFRLF